MTTEPKLALHEEILLLALRDSEGTVASGAMLDYALGGAFLAQLLLHRRIGIDPASKRKLVDVLDATPTGDPLLDECLERMVAARRRAALQTWVPRLAQVKRLRHRVARHLCQLNILEQVEDKVLWVFSRTLYPEVTHGPEQRLIERLRAAIFSEANNLEADTVVLIALAHHAGLLGNVFPRRDLKQRKHRLRQITSGNAVGQATKEAIEAVQAAIMVACIMPVIMTTVTS